MRQHRHFDPGGAVLDCMGKVVSPGCYVFGGPKEQVSQVDLHLPPSDRNAVTEVFDDLPLLGRFEEVQSLGETLSVC